MNDPIEARLGSDASHNVSYVDVFDDDMGIELGAGVKAISVATSGAGSAEGEGRDGRKTASLYSLFDQRQQSFERELAEEEAQRSTGKSRRAASTVGGGVASDSGEGSTAASPHKSSDKGKEIEHVSVPALNAVAATEIPKGDKSNAVASVLILLGVMFLDRLSYWGVIVPLKSMFSAWGWNFGDSWALVSSIKGLGRRFSRGSERWP